MRQTRPMEERFWEKVEFRDGHGFWTGAIANGYGWFGDTYYQVNGARYCRPCKIIKEQQRRARKGGK